MAAFATGRREAAHVAPRVAALVRAFEEVAATRMAGLPVMHPQLRVEAVGFARDEDGLGGVLITPWFMNLVCLPDGGDALAVGAARERRVGGEAFGFIGAEMPGVGRFEACSLCSPMFHFADQDAARATAQAVLDLLRKSGTAAEAPAMPSRRALFLGRAGAGRAP
ncbi:MAG: [NiFe]-hydrogenase assembly chaperone HybE [Burkholderiales bacterium]|nr:[NiFe]-hydrogenase assembly chaperone HybE [Burkholderiales bacterium]